MGQRVRVSRNFSIRDSDRNITVTPNDAVVTPLRAGAVVRTTDELSTVLGDLVASVVHPGGLKANDIVFHHDSATGTTGTQALTLQVDPAYNAGESAWDITFGSVNPNIDIAAGDRFVLDPDIEGHRVLAYKFQDGIDTLYTNGGQNSVIAVPNSGLMEFYAERATDIDLYVESTGAVFDTAYFFDATIQSPRAYVTPEDFNAAGDGTADDSLALQKAFDWFRVRGRGELRLIDDNTYKCINVQVLGSNIKVTGGGKLEALTASTTQSILKIGDGTLGNVENIMIDGVEFDGAQGAGQPAASSNAHAIYMDVARNVRVVNCYIHDTVQDGIYAGVNAVGLADPCEDLVISNNRFENCHRNFISIVAGDQVTITGNTGVNFGTIGIDVEPNATQVSSCKRISITGNYVRPAATPIHQSGGNDRSLGISAKNGVGTAEDDYSDVTITGNTIEGVQDLTTPSAIDSSTQYPRQGILVQDYLNVTITGNTITDCGWGIYAGLGDTTTLTTESSYGTISANAVKRCTEIAIWAMCRWSVSGNSVTNNGAGIHVRGAWCSVTGNIVWDNGYVDGVGSPYDANTIPRGIRVDNQGDTFGGGPGETGTVVSGNLVFDSRSGASRLQTHGISLDAEADECLIMGNRIFNHPTVDIIDGSTGSQIFHNFADDDGTMESSVAWDPASIAIGGMEAKDITITGAAVGDYVLVGFSLDVTDLSLTATVTAADTVTAVLANNTAGAVDLGSGTLYAKVIKRSGAY